MPTRLFRGLHVAVWVTVVLLVSILLTSCESVAGRELAACNGDKECAAAVNARWATWADNYAAQMRGDATPIQQLGLQMANPQSARRPVLSCYNSAGIVNCC